MPNSSVVNIALAKKSKIVTGSEMPPFFAAKLKANGGDPSNSMLARFGGSVTISGLRIATVTALHSNGVDPDYIGGELGFVKSGCFVLECFGDPELASRERVDGGRNGQF
jgi:hypothetical protein